MVNNITLSSATKLSDLLSAYPWLKEALVEISDKFRLLNNTPLGKVMANKATLAEMSKHSGIEEAHLMEQLTALIETH